MSDEEEEGHYFSRGEQGITISAEIEILCTPHA